MGGADRRRDPQRPAELRPVPLDRAGLLHRAESRCQRAAALSRLAQCRRARAWWSARSRNVGGNIKVDFRLWDVLKGDQATGFQLHQPAQQLAAARPHHRRCGLQARDRRGGLLRHPRRLCLGDRPAQQPRQAHRHHGPGRREQPLHHRRPHDRPHAALLADAAGDRLHGVRRPQHAAQGLPAERRFQPPRADGQFPGHELRAALLARRHQGGDELVTGWSHQPLRDGRARPRRAPADQHACN